MKLEIRVRHTGLPEALRSYVERRLRFSPGRFGGRVGRVTARIFDLNGPRGGNDKCCRLSAGVVPTGGLVVEATDADLYAAINRATERLGRSFRRHLERRRTAMTGHESVRVERGLRKLLRSCG
jgi:ribosomal subunit interface protein